MPIKEWTQEEMLRERGNARMLIGLLQKEISGLKKENADLKQQNSAMRKKLHGFGM